MPRVPWVYSFVTGSIPCFLCFLWCYFLWFSGLLCSRVLPLVVAFILYCLLCFVSDSISFSPRSSYLFLSFREPFFVCCTCQVLAPGVSFSKFIIISDPGPFWLREPGFKAVCYLRSGTVLASGASFVRLLLMVRDRFGPGSQFLKKFVCYGSGSQI